MIKSISYWSMPGGLAGAYPIEDALAKAQAENFEGLELCIATEGVLTPGTSQSQCESIRRQIDDSDLTVQTLASGMSWACSPTSDDSSVREQSIELHADALERAAWLGCQAMLFVPGIVKSPLAPAELIPYDLAVERARAAVARLLETAERLNIDLCLENVWNGLFPSPLELAWFVDSFDSDRLGIYFDIGNILRYHQHPPHWIELLGNRIKRVHVKDYAESFANGSYSFCDLGAGDVPWEETMAALQAMGYDGTIVAEMLPYDEGLLQRTSVALDEILQRSEMLPTKPRRRIDPAPTAHSASSHDSVKTGRAVPDSRA